MAPANTTAVERRPPYRPRARRAGRFAKWLDADGAPTVAVLARQLGVTTAVIYNWRSGRFFPSRDHATRIQEISGGAVPAVWWSKQRRRE